MDQLGEDTCKGEEGSRRRIYRPLSWGADEREEAVAAEMVGGANPGEKIDRGLEEEGGREL